MSTVSETVLMHGGCCGVRRDEKGRAIYNQLHGCPSVLSLFPSLRVQGPLARALALALQCAPLGVGGAYCQLLAWNYFKGCPAATLALTLHCSWSRVDSSAFLAVHALLYNMWVSVLCLVGFLLERNLGPATIEQMFRAQHGDVEGAGAVEARNNQLKTPAGCGLSQPLPSPVEGGKTKSQTKTKTKTNKSGQRSQSSKRS